MSKNTARKTQIAYLLENEKNYPILFCDWDDANYAVRWRGLLRFRHEGRENEIAGTVKIADLKLNLDLSREDATPQVGVRRCARYPISGKMDRMVNAVAQS